MCSDGEIRIANAIIENEGRIEVCFKGVWGAVCDEGWDKTDAFIACKQIGFPRLGIMSKPLFVSLVIHQQSQWHIATHILAMDGIPLCIPMSHVEDGKLT